MTSKAKFKEIKVETFALCHLKFMIFDKLLEKVWAPYFLNAKNNLKGLSITFS